MFGWFKKNKEAEPLPNYDFVSVDIHSHVLPGIDDGAATVGDSMLLIERMVAMGIKKVIATPHIMADYFRNNAETIGNALQVLKEHVAPVYSDLIIEAAAEHYFDEHFLDLIETDQLMLMKNKYVLFEFSFTNRPPSVVPILQKITGKGLTPILAHPERYPYLTLAEVVEMREWGCLIQLNTISLTGYYGKQVRQSAEKLVDAGLIDFISSDMHHLKHADALQQALKLPYVKMLSERDLMNKQLL
ncbi:capsular biosynthesis protein [Mucilaginibacter robiniae]|uniref:protein-tyrosine-phosphatase n=1 Tax=Mucilaginibacter robiniae TaxID=2728022 RepID=A0A7L5E1R5_9SPHI|nr:CpsB/CapC family capsule biosynthesis tyrosine phosphatase [Mucilaginibacter robiniae]QJD96458.1 capsular biosynthesis protein [Mucilaginibacter robiniae]